MATTADISLAISNRLVVVIIKELVWADVANAVGSLSTPDKDAIVAAAKTNDAGEIGRIVLKGVQTYSRTNADSEAATMMTDNNLDFTELVRVLG